MVTSTVSSTFGFSTGIPEKNWIMNYPIPVGIYLFCFMENVDAKSSYLQFPSERRTKLSHFIKKVLQLLTIRWYNATYMYIIEIVALHFFYKIQSWIAHTVNHNTQLLFLLFSCYLLWNYFPHTKNFYWFITIIFILLRQHCCISCNLFYQSNPSPVQSISSLGLILKFW